MWLLPIKLTRFHICLLIVGSSSVATQLVLIREFMSTFGGNELVMGVALGIWLLCGGGGSKLVSGPAEKAPNPEKWLFYGHLILAVLPLVQLAAIRGLPLLYVRGQMLGLSSATVFGSLIIAPYVLISGAMIPLAGRLEPDNQSTARVYVVDTAGDIAGGLVFSLIFVLFFSHWQTMAFFGILHTGAAWILGRDKRPVRSVLWAVLVAALICTGLWASPVSRTWRLPGQDIIIWKNSPFGQISITMTGNQYNVRQDGILLFTSDDPSVEALVHPAMCQVPQGADVLLIAGGVFGSIEEIAKHKPHRIDYVELDKSILEMDSSLFSSLKRPEVHAHVSDGRLFIKHTKNKYDALIIDLPDPENAQLNRFYTQEFFSEARSVLKPDGVLYFTLAGADNYLEEGGLALNRTVFAAANKVFENVTVLAGPTHYFIGSKNRPDLDIEQKLNQRGIKTKQLVAYDLATMIDPFRVDELAKLLSAGQARINRDLSPWAFGHMLSIWMTKSKSSNILFWAVIVLVLGFCIVAWGGDHTRLTILSSGFAGMGIELALVLLFQVVYGYAYTILCIFITLFLVGAAAGGFWLVKKNASPTKHFLAGETGLVAVSVLALLSGPICVSVSGKTTLFLMGHAVLPALIIASGWFVGVQFAAASRLVSGSGARVTGNLYWADLAGASCGTLVMGLVLLPRLGIQGVLASVLVVKIITLALNLRR